MYITKIDRLFDSDIKPKCFSDAVFGNGTYIPVMPLRKTKQFVSGDVGSHLKNIT